MPSDELGSSRGQPLLKPKSIEEHASEYRRTMDDELPACIGFSARLNMLWDLAGAAPAQIEGRVISVLGINDAWRETEIRNWLQKDILPPPLELRNMVKFFGRAVAGQT